MFLSLFMATALMNGAFAQNDEKKTSFCVKAEVNSNFYLVSDSDIISSTSNALGVVFKN